MARTPSRRAGRREKPKGRDYAAEYRRRMAGPGDSQTKRGHGAETPSRQRAPGKTEHGQRVERERSSGGLTTYQRGVIKREAYEVARRIKGSDPAQVAEAMRRKVESSGWRMFQDMRELKRQLAKNARGRRTQKGRVITLDISGRTANRMAMQQFAERHGIDWRWLFYK